MPKTMLNNGRWRAGRSPLTGRSRAIVYIASLMPYNVFFSIISYCGAGRFAKPPFR